MNDVNINNENAKLVWVLSLITAIIGTVTAIPFIGMRFNFYYIPSITMLVLSIIIMVKGKGLPVKKVGSILTIISVALSIICALILIFVAITKPPAFTPTMTNQETNGAIANIIALGIFTAIFTFPAWVLQIIATVFHYINFVKVKRVDEELLYYNYQQYGAMFEQETQVNNNPMNNVPPLDPTVIVSDEHTSKDKEI